MLVESMDLIRTGFQNHTAVTVYPDGTDNIIIMGFSFINPTPDWQRYDKYPELYSGFSKTFNLRNLF